MEDGAAAVCASVICLGMYALLAGGAGWLAHRRMVKVERELGRPALPAPESAQLLYAGASVVSLSAAILAAVGLLERDWSRAGRNAFFLMLGCGRPNAHGYVPSCDYLGLQLIPFGHPYFDGLGMIASPIFIVAELVFLGGAAHHHPDELLAEGEVRLTPTSLTMGF